MDSPRVSVSTYLFCRYLFKFLRFVSIWRVCMRDVGYLATRALENGIASRHNSG